MNFAQAFGEPLCPQVVDVGGQDHVKENPESIGLRAYIAQHVSAWGRGKLARAWHGDMRQRYRPYSADHGVGVLGTFRATTYLGTHAGGTQRRCA